jgi:hypothetical protein
MNQAKISLLTFLCLIKICVNAGNPIRYYRSLEVKDTGWHSIVLPPEIYLKANSNLSDVRVYKISDKDSVEIPYLRLQNETTSTIKWDNLKLFNLVKSGARSYATFELKQGNAIDLDFKFNNANYDINLSAEGSNDNVNWFFVKDSIRLVSLLKDGEHFVYSKFKLDDISFKYLRVSYSNFNDLNLSAVLQCDKKVNQIKLSQLILPALSSEVKNKTTTVDFLLATPKELSEFIPEVNFNGEYVRHFTLYGYRDSVLVNKKWIKNYFELSAGILNSYSNNSIYFSQELVKGLQLNIDNADNIPLKIVAAKVFVFPIVLKTYFPDLNGRYIVSYGDHSLSFPDYDIVRYSEKIPLATDTIVVLSEKSIPIVNKKPLFSLPDNLLWFVLLAIIVLLSFFTFKMIKAKA